ncbi:diphthine-ammonia ligase [Malassezia pachydermatis]
MYQTVGHDAVHAVAQALGVPLYRRPIQGAPKNQGAIYGSRKPTHTQNEDQTDETEDLFHLLLDVKQHHPDVEGVSVGAILSNYQRVRVEHVALRPELQLQPLAYLWQRNQSTLLHDMTSAGLEAILIKVAGIGLTERDLGRTLAMMTPKLEQLHELYGAHVCGEGGEYETLTLDAPIFQKHLTMYVLYLSNHSDEKEVVVHSDAAFASVSYLKFPRMHGEDKETYGADVAKACMPVPPALDPTGEMYIDAIADRIPSFPSSPIVISSPAPWQPMLSVYDKGDWLVVADIAASEEALSFEDEVKQVFTKLQKTLAVRHLQTTDIVHMNVYLSSQTYFGPLNAIYRTHFGAAPPSRACIALPAGLGARILLDAVVCRPSSPPDHRCLHVQSRSFWAPANIGPYSQAVGTHGRIYMAGQIGMEPISLDVPTNVPHQLAFALQHQRRIALAVREWDMHGYIEGGLCWVATPSADTDAWADTLKQLWSTPPSEEIHAHTQTVPDDAWLGQPLNDIPLLIVHVASDGLPKQSLSEWQLTARMPGEDVQPKVAKGTWIAHGVQCTYHIQQHDGLSCGVAVLSPTEKPATSPASQAPFLDAWQQAMHVKLVSHTETPRASVLALVSSWAPSPSPAITHIPSLGWHLAGVEQAPHWTPASCALVWT